MIGLICQSPVQQPDSLVNVKDISSEFQSERRGGRLIPQS